MTGDASFSNPSTSGSSSNRDAFGANSPYGGCPRKESSAMGTDLTSIFGLGLDLMIPVLPYWSTSGTSAGFGVGRVFGMSGGGGSGGG